MILYFGHGLFLNRDSRDTESGRLSLTTHDISYRVKNETEN